MTRPGVRPPGRARPLLLLAVGAGTVLIAGPAGAAPADSAPRAPSASEAAALELLGNAARAARTRAWTGSQYVASWRDGIVSSGMLEVRHDPRTGTRVRDMSGDGASTLPPGALDEHLLVRLADRYALAVSGSGTCSGRRADVVEARRPDGRVAGRFWLDRDTGLTLRREVWDPQGRQLRSSAFVNLEVGPDNPAALPARAVWLGGAPEGAGWVPPAELPGGYALFEAARPARAGGAVLHLAYSDGLSTVSVFSQPGRLGDTPRSGFTPATIGRTAVWVHTGTPERVVWGGAGQVFTMVSDAGHQDLVAAVRALPRDDAPDGGALARLRRGLSRVGSWLDPRA